MNKIESDYNPISNLLNIHGDEKLISFAAGLPANESFEWGNIFNVLDDISSSKLYQYGEVEGNNDLREMLVKWVERYNIYTKKDNVLLTSGATQGIELVADMFINSDDLIAIEKYSYISAKEIFQSYGAKFLSLEADDKGIITDGLEELLLEKKPKFLYLISDFSNPTSISYSLERRAEIAKIAATTNTIIIEDNSYADLGFDGEIKKAIKSYDISEMIIFISSFSKILSPGIRLGYMIANDMVISKLTKLKETKDIHSSTLAQQLVLKLLEKNFFENHLTKIKEIYLEKRNIMSDYLDEYLDDIVQYETPKGGIFYWIQLPKGIDSNKLLEDSLAESLMFLPGQVFYTGDDNDENQFIRLNYSYPTKEEIKEGLKRLSSILFQLTNNN